MRTRIPAVLAVCFLAASAAALQAQQDTTRRDTTARDTTHVQPDTTRRDTTQAQPDTTRRDTTQAQPDTTRHDTTQARPDTTQQPAPAQPAPVTPAPADTTPAAVPAPVPAPAAEAPAAPAASSDTMVGVRPGMSDADVRQRWGEPVTVRHRNDWEYMFYTNGQERRLGYYDTVFLHNGQVVDAIVRGEGHVYLGLSSSPEGRVPMFTPPANPAPAAADTTHQPAEVGGVRVNPAQPVPRPED